VQKIASHLIYIERGTPYVFDRLSAFEEWLANPPGQNAKDVFAASTTSQKASGTMSKNKRDRLEKEAADLEAKIASTEAVIQEIELSFQVPNQTTNWEDVHRRYDELKQALDSLYGQLNDRWDALSKNA
jgi:hypothetical protein